MASTAKQTDTRLAPSDGDDNYLHIVSYGEWIWNETIRRKVPRALCGVSLLGDPDKPQPGANAPDCPKCNAIAGPGKRTFIPGKWR
jgi:hypothetical protein